MQPALTLLGGGVLLYLGAAWLVGGASRLALALRIPQIVVGLTVVAYGTSAPELVIGVEAALSGHGAIALGNAVGSNIANVGLILGTATLLKPARVAPELARRELPVLLGATFALPLVLANGRIVRAEGLLLTAAAVAYTVFMIRAARSAQSKTDAFRAASETASAADAVGAPAGGGKLRHAVVAVVGLAVLVVGGRLFVDGATALARAWGMSERVVGLTIVAVGTSLPELATSLVAAWRGHSDIAVGNVVGSNVFNLLLCLGVGAVARPIDVSFASVVPDLVALGLMTLLLATFLRSERTMSRAEGALALCAYAAFVANVVVG